MMCRSKAVIYISSIAAFLMSNCNASRNAIKKDDTQKAKIIDPSITNPLELIDKSDCRMCHKIEEKLLGPSWLEVSRKYVLSDSIVKYLSNKIIIGGYGSWGSTPMVPHTGFNSTQVDSIVRYILNLKNQ